MSHQIMPEEQLNNPHTERLIRRVKVLALSYFGISILTLVAIPVFRNNPVMVTPAVWVRGSIVVASSVVMTSFVFQMARGRSRAYLRLRLVSAIMLVAVVIIIAIPGDFPLWMKLEQGICGVLLLGICIIVNGKQLRRAYRAR